MEGLDAKITALAATHRYAPVVHALMCLARNLDAHRVGTAVESVNGPASRAALSAPIGVWFPPSNLPVLPGSQGGITKTGNTHARRLLVHTAGPIVRIAAQTPRHRQRRSPRKLAGWCWSLVAAVHQEQPWTDK